MQTGWRVNIFSLTFEAGVNLNMNYHYWSASDLGRSPERFRGMHARWFGKFERPLHVSPCCGGGRPHSAVVKEVEQAAVLVLVY